eukprot:9654786-Heterocapsa_arctica.AAC.1
MAGPNACEAEDLMYEAIAAAWSSIGRWTGETYRHIMFWDSSMRQGTTSSLAPSGPGGRVIDRHASPDHFVILLRGEGEVDGGGDIAAVDRGEEPSRAAHVVKAGRRPVRGPPGVAAAPES